MNGKVVYHSGVSEASEWASHMVLREARGPGDTENAMRRLESRYGIPWRTFWTLRYRAPADVMVGLYRQLQAAYTMECQRQESAASDGDCGEGI